MRPDFHIVATASVAAVEGDGVIESAGTGRRTAPDMDLASALLRAVGLPTTGLKAEARLQNSRPQGLQPENSQPQGTTQRGEAS